MADHGQRSREAGIFWQGSSDERANRLAVGLCYFADCFDVVLVGEVEDEHVVGLPVEWSLNSVRLVSDESSEETNVAHPRDDVVPVCVFEVEVGSSAKRKAARSQLDERIFVSSPRKISTIIRRTRWLWFFRLTTRIPPPSMACRIFSSVRGLVSS